MENYIIIAIMICIVFGIGLYLFKSKKGGKTSCIGCPCSKTCSGKCNHDHI